jgi:hypothetical protein
MGDEEGISQGSEEVSLRQNGVGTGFIGANAILPKGHLQFGRRAHYP